jgi:enterochelin esterase-like enzyme
MRLNAFIQSLLALCFNCCLAQTNRHSIEQKTINGFKLSIYLPPGYDTIKECKVLYFNDGQTVFGEYGLNADAMADELISNKLIEPIIIVGIHSDANRTSNYLPYPDEGAKQDFGNYQPNADKYTKQIAQKIIPYIEKNYKAKSDNGIAGYSFGGLHATWAALNYPEYFSFSGSLSPSYWVKDFEIFKEGSKAKANQIYYFDVGTGEWNYYVPMLLHSKLPMLKNIFYYEDFGGKHTVSNWRGNRTRNILLLFAGITDTSNYTWEIKQEIIRSEYTGKFYPRLNPVITYSNGLTCSISYAATFTLLNPDDGVVNKDGSFRFINPKDLNVKIIYREKEKIVTINYDEVEKIKAFQAGIMN